MSFAIKQGHARIVAARQRVLDIRGERIEQLLRLRTYLRALLSDFVTNVDPVTGARLAEINAEGSKTNGDLAMTLSLFEGTKLRFEVDSLGRFGVSTVPAELMSEVGRIVDLRVAPDASRAEFSYEPAAQPGTKKTGDVAKLVALIVERAVATVESDLVGAPQPDIGHAGRGSENGRAVAAAAR